MARTAEPVASRLDVPSEAFESIIDAARSGANWAWSRLVEDLHGKLTGYVRRLGAPDPDNLVGETWLHVARGIHRFNGNEQAFRSWVFMIAHHRVIDDRRSRRRKPAVPTETSILDRRGKASKSAEAEAMEAPEFDQVYDLLNALTADQREVVLLRVVGGFGISEIAEIIGKKPAAVQALQQRAFRMLERKFLQRPVRSETSSSVTGAR